MKIYKIGGFIGGAMLLAACHSNQSKSAYVAPVQRAYNKAVRHMMPDEIEKMKEGAIRQIPDFSQDVSDKIYYWDSLLTKEKAIEAYKDGRNYIKDSLNGIHYPERQFRLPLDTVIRVPRHGNDIIYNDKVELGADVGGVKLYDYIQKEPKNSVRKNGVHKSKNNHATHYYGVIGSVAEQRYAYNKGKESMLDYVFADK
jgi:hypothetical protein